MSADFNHPLSYERPFKFLRHLVGPLGIDNIIAVSAINIHCATFKLKRMEMDMETETNMETALDMERKLKLTIYVFATTPEGP